MDLLAQVWSNGSLCVIVKFLPKGRESILVYQKFEIMVLPFGSETSKKFSDPDENIYPHGNFDILHPSHGGWL